MIDFDYNATTPIKDSVRASVQPYLEEQYGNPSSVHRLGQRTKAAVEQARESIAESVNADPESVVLTGSGSEANTLAIKGTLNHPYSETTILTTPVEHSSVRDTVKELEDRGATVKRLPVNANGQIDRSILEDYVTEDLDMVTMMAVNNETGVIFPVETLGELCVRQGVPLHVDAVQAYGKVPLDFCSLPVDTLSISAHKIGGLKGAGALVAPKSLPLEPIIHGGHQERDRRGGTENVPGVIGFGTAAARIDPREFHSIGSPRDSFENWLKTELTGVHVVGEGTDRIANTSGVLFEGIQGEDVVMRLDLEGYATATGAACTSGSSQPSHVIQSIPLPGPFTPESFVRFSFSPDHDRETLLEGAKTVTETVRDLRETSFVTSQIEPVERSP